MGNISSNCAIFFIPRFAFAPLMGKSERKLFKGKRICQGLSHNIFPSHEFLLPTGLNVLFHLWSNQTNAKYKVAINFMQI